MMMTCERNVNSIKTVFFFFFFFLASKRERDAGWQDIFFLATFLATFLAIFWQFSMRFVTQGKPFLLFQFFRGAP